MPHCDFTYQETNRVSSSHSLHCAHVAMKPIPGHIAGTTKLIGLISRLSTARVLQSGCESQHNSCCCVPHRAVLASSTYAGLHRRNTQIMC